MWQRVKKNRNGSPRSWSSTRDAPRPRRRRGVEHLAIRPKSDLALLYGLARIMLSRGWIDREFVEAHTSGFEAFRPSRRRLRSWSGRARATGLARSGSIALAEAIHEAERVSFWWTMGVNQGHQAVRTAQAIINLAF